MALYREAEAERRLSLERLRVGSEAPDIHLTDPQGIIQKLSDYRGKIVILDFWAAWCQPCRKENQILSQLYKKYNKQGLEIFSVSLDNKKDLWIRAINVDKITWVQVSDLKYPSSPIQKLYNLEEIPQSYILDREGRIIAHNLKGEDLDKRIKDLLEKY
jgi:peroxiredoxin